jgi:hypothetical protein
MDVKRQGQSWRENKRKQRQDWAGCIWETLSRLTGQECKDMKVTGRWGLGGQGLHTSSKSMSLSLLVKGSYRRVGGKVATQPRQMEGILLWQ